MLIGEVWAVYAGNMTVPVPLVVQALRARLPEVTSRRLHKLLYYVQGHHLATFGVPLISERIVAWDSGPAVGELWELDQRSRQASGDSSTTFAAAGPADGPAHSAAGALGEAELNTVGYVASRYGALSARDLEHLSRSETPWTRADVGRPTGQSSLIELSWMRDYFRSDGDEADDLTAPPLDAEVVRTWLAEAPTRRRGPALPDNLEELCARVRRTA